MMNFMSLGKPEILTDIDNLQSTVATHSTQLEETTNNLNDRGINITIPELFDINDISIVVNSIMVIMTQPNQRPENLNLSLRLI